MAKKRIGYIKNAILCDDVREEKDSNKYILIGVYAGDLVVPSFPATIAPKLYFEYFADRPGRYQIEVTYKWEAREIVPIKGQLNVVRVGVTSLHLPQIPIEVTAPTNLEILLKVGGDAAATLINKRVIIPSMDPAASPLPSGQTPPSVLAS